VTKKGSAKSQTQQNDTGARIDETAEFFEESIDEVPAQPFSAELVAMIGSGSD
jgi:hypothetical protein